MRIRQARARARIGLAAAWLAFGTFGAFGAGSGRAAAAAGAITLDEVLAAASANVEVAIATQSLAAARADVAAADHAPLPQLSTKLSQIDLQNGIGPGSLLRDKRIDKGVGIDWTWERGDKRRLRTAAALGAADAAAADLQQVRLDQALAAQSAFFDLLLAQQRLVQVQAIERSAAELAGVAERRVRAGDLALQDAARAGIEADRARADSASARLDVQRARAALAVVVGRDPGSPLEAAGPWPDAAAAGDSAALRERLEQRADVRAAVQRVRAAEAALEAARAQRATDVTWGVSLDHIPGTSTRQLELRASLPLQWGYRYEGEVARAQAQLAQTREQLDRTRRDAGAESERLGAEIAAAAERARRYDQDITPRSIEVAERAELAYRKGALGLTDLLDARRTLRAALIDQLAARADLAKAVVALQLRTRTAP